MAKNHGLCCKTWFCVGLRSGLSTSPGQINNEEFLTDFYWFLILLPFFFFFFFWQGCKQRASSLTIAARAAEAPLLPALWEVYRMSVQNSHLISAPGNYSPYPAILTSFPFSATCTQKAKKSSPRGIYGMFYIPGQHFQHFVLGLKKEARQSPAWVSSLDVANKCHFVLTCATQAVTEWGTGRSRQTRDLKAGGWSGDWMSWRLHFQLVLTQSIMQRGGMLVPRFFHCKAVNVLPTPITKFKPAGSSNPKHQLLCGHAHKKKQSLV